MSAMVLASIMITIAVFCSHCVTGIPLADFYSFGATVNDTTLFPNDDGSSLSIRLSMPFPFFDENHEIVFVNNNGIVSFTRGVGQYTPDPFPLSGDLELIAPYWADVDTRGTGTVWYRETTDPVLLDRAKEEIQMAFISQGSFSPSSLFIATWDHVGYFNNHTDLTNTFQCIMATNGLNSFVIFLYADGGIQWTTGDASDGVGGFGGTPAHVGFNAGDGIRFATVPGSRTDDIINIADTSNVGVPGMWVFRVDEEDIAVGGCSPEPQVPLTVVPRAVSILGGTAVQVAGACLEETDNITCIFDGVEVDGVYISTQLALCVSPQSSVIGRVSLQLVVNGSNGVRARGETVFFFMSIDDGAKVEYHTDDLSFKARERIRVTWPPSAVLPFLDPTSYTVDIELFCLGEQDNALKQVATLASEVPNLGSALVILPGFVCDSKESVNPVSIQVKAEANDREKRQPRLRRRHGGLWGGTAYRQPDKDEILNDKCEEWYKNEPDVDISRVLPCPPDEDKAGMDNNFSRESHTISSRYHPEADSCYRQQVMRSSGEDCPPGSQCCYKNNRLLTGPFSGGTLDLASPRLIFSFNPFKCFIKHRRVDVIPYNYCCKGRYRFINCEKYYEKRPSVDSSRYRCRQARTFGDPHLVTLDGLKYTFNGRGEFILIETADNSFTLQGRMVDAVDESGSSAPGTVFSAIVARQSNSDTVQIGVSRLGITALVNGHEVDFADVPEQQFNNVTVQYNGNNTIIALFSSGASIRATEEVDILSDVSVSLPSSFQDLTSGLLGSFNGDTADDLLPRDGTVPISTSSSLQEIHEQFGITWIISDPAESLFTYSTGESFEIFTDPAYVPVFGTVFSDPVLEAQALELCGNDSFCLFDVATTGRMDIGLTTLTASQVVEEIAPFSVPIVCDPPCVNGGCVANDTCSCNPGYTGPLCTIPVISDCPEDLCENGGTCQLNGNLYLCTCAPGFTGVLCQTLIPDLEVYFIGDTPVIEGSTFSAMFVANRNESIAMTCQLFQSGSPDPKENCSSGVYSRSGLPPGNYKLRVVATDSATGQSDVASRRLRIHAPPQCGVNLINRGLVIDGNRTTTEFRGFGSVGRFFCILDRNDRTDPCSSPFVTDGLTSGEHHIKIAPHDCGKGATRTPIAFTFLIP